MRIAIPGALREMGENIKPTVTENHPTAQNTVRLARADGLGSLIVIGLTREEVRQLAPAFLEDVSVHLYTAR